MEIKWPKKRKESAIKICRERTHYKHGNILETFLEKRSVQSVSSYQVFRFERLHNLHFAISKLMKEYTITYLSADQLSTGEAQKGGM